MSNAYRTLYIGVTNNLERRVAEHKQGFIPGFASQYNIKQLVYFEAFSDVKQAITREKQLKGKTRAKKITLIESLNPLWKDLSIQTTPISDSSLRSE